MYIFHFPQIIRDNAVEQLKNEVSIQTICGHNSFIVKCLAFWQTHREIYLCKIFPRPVYQLQFRLGDCRAANGLLLTLFIIVVNSV